MPTYLRRRQHGRHQVNGSVLLALTFVGVAASLTAQDGLSGFGTDGQPRLPGFGRDARLRAKVTDADRRQAAATMAKHDLNGNGELDGAELLHAKLSDFLVRKHDRNDDNKINLLEETLRWTLYRLDKESENRRKVLQAKRAAKKQETAAPSPPVNPLIQQRANLCAGLANEIIAQQDVNGNKQLEISEWGRARRFGDLSRSDTNRDRVITQVELMVWLTRRLPPLSASRLAKPLRLFDIDGDGQIAMHEFADNWDAQKLADFQALDKDDDGIISPLESHSAPIPRGAIRFVSNEVKSIQQGGQVTSNLWIDDDITIGDLDVLVAMTKQNDFQTRLTLVGPQGQTVTLFAGGWQPWSGAHVFDGTLIDDEAAFSESMLPQPPFPRRLRTDALKSHEPGLTTFDSSSARGLWKLVVTNLDNAAGALHHWSLVVTPAK